MYFLNQTYFHGVTGPVQFKGNEQNAQAMSLIVRPLHFSKSKPNPIVYKSSFIDFADVG